MPLITDQRPAPVLSLGPGGDFRREYFGAEGAGRLVASDSLDFAAGDDAPGSFSTGFTDAGPVRRRALGAQEAALLIRRMREKAKLTQKELAELIGVEQPQISRLERQPDAAHGPSYVTMRRIVSACKLTWRSPVTEIDL